MSVLPARDWQPFLQLSPGTPALFLAGGRRKERCTRTGVHSLGATGVQHTRHKDDGKAQGTPSDTRDVSTTPPRIWGGFCSPTTLTIWIQAGLCLQLTWLGLKEAAAGKGPACVPQPLAPNSGTLSPERAGHKPGDSGKVPTQPDLTARTAGSPGGRLMCGATRDGSSRQKLCSSRPAGHRQGHSEEPPSRPGTQHKR